MFLLFLITQYAFTGVLSRAFLSFFIILLDVGSDLWSQPRSGLPLIVGFPGVLGWLPVGQTEPPRGRRAGLPTAGRIARREGPRCQGLAENLGTVAEAVFLYYKVYKLFGAL